MQETDKCIIMFRIILCNCMDLIFLLRSDKHIEFSPNFYVQPKFTTTYVTQTKIQRNIDFHSFLMIRL